MVGDDGVRDEIAAEHKKNRAVSREQLGMVI